MLRLTLVQPATSWRWQWHQQKRIKVGGDLTDGKKLFLGDLNITDSFDGLNFAVSGPSLLEFVTTSRGTRVWK